MIIDLNTAPPNFPGGRNYEIVICGAGVAGITLALQLSELGMSNIALLEAGDSGYTSESQTLYEGGISGRPYAPLTEVRLRMLGGTSGHWEGWCRPLDAYDFEGKTYADPSGWPINKSDLDPYLEKTISILDLRDNAEFRQMGRRMQWKLAGEHIEEIDFWASAPTRFAKKYREILEKSAHINCFLNANVTDIRLNDNHDRVAGVEFRNYANDRFSIQPRCFVLAAGGIENPRILLNCNSQRPQGIGNEHDLVGRYFAEHPHHVVGNFALQNDYRDEMVRAFQASDDQLHRLSFFSPSVALMKEEEILNFGLRLRPDDDMLKFYGRQSAFKARMRSLVCATSLGQRIVASLQGSPVECPPAFDGDLRIVIAQALNPSSRVKLSADADRFGLRRADLDWQLSPMDKRTIRRGTIRFAEAFARRDIGRIKIADWVLSDNDEIPLYDHTLETFGYHHMCTTRMSDSPLTGVVNSNQQVFGVDNLYIAGSSAFGSAGHANPTLTIVQMTLRLAEHLAGVNGSVSGEQAETV